MSHANAAQRARLMLAQLVVNKGWTYAAAAETFMVQPDPPISGPTNTAPKARLAWSTADQPHRNQARGPCGAS